MGADASLPVAERRRAAEAVLRWSGVVETDFERVIHSREWRELLAKIIGAVTPFPKAADALGKALERHGGTSNEEDIIPVTGNVESPQMAGLGSDK